MYMYNDTCRCQWASFIIHAEVTAYLCKDVHYRYLRYFATIPHHSSYVDMRMYTRHQVNDAIALSQTLHVYKCKNEIRCRDDTVPKTVDTRSHCKVWLRACNNLPQPPKNEM